MEPLGPANILVKALDEDVVEGHRGLVEPLRPVNILVKTKRKYKGVLIFYGPQRRKE